MGLFSHATVESEQVATTVRQHWDLELGKCIKASQNHTFGAEAKDGTKYIVRVTPNPTTLQKIIDEITFVHYVAQSANLKGQICSFVPPNTASSTTLYANWVVRNGDLLIVVSEFAKGEMLDYQDRNSWMFDQRLVEACGRWLGSLHVASAAFCKEYPLVAARIQRWDEVHDGVMQGSPLDRNDQIAEAKRDPKLYGILHGDVNCSNFFFSPHTGQLSVFDTDQVQQGWFMYDLAQPIFSPYLHSRALGMTDHVPKYTNWLVTGYESILGPNTVDRNALHRMLMLRKGLYDRFCRRALAEGDVPKDMKGFLEFIVNWLDREKREMCMTRVLFGGAVVAAAFKMFWGRESTLH